ncbi:NAD-dependent epimerase/dehydratase family protein [Marinibaculum pumilum]|uniref:NAD-dependent epimerase/dehydratase family protein n=1 Tax=Marinibaculum pumilum TaxID=1766165 RepID=A0ABV7L2D0_9PROT
MNDQSAPAGPLPERIADVDALEELLSRPSPAVIRDLSALDGDIILLGAGGKIGPSLARMARRACPGRRIYAVARFSEAGVREGLEADGIECLTADLLDRAAIEGLPKAKNVLFLAGRKFGSSGQQALTWAMNAHLPALVAEAFRESRIVAFSTGCVYPFVPVNSGGATEDLAPDPPGEYAQSCVGRERMFEHFSQVHGTPGRLFRLNYAIDMRYGVLLDVAEKVRDRRPVDVTMGHVNVIWQGDANALALRCLAHATAPTSPINVSGPETISVRWLAEEFARRLDVPVEITGSEAERGWLTNTAEANRLFGYPDVALKQLIDWTAAWVAGGGTTHNKPTKFEVRDGRY